MGGGRDGNENGNGDGDWNEVSWSGNQGEAVDRQP